MRPAQRPLIWTALRLSVVIWTVVMIAATVAWIVLSAGEVDSMAGILGAALCCVVVGSILTVKVPSNAVGPLAMVAGSAGVVYLFGNAYATASLSTSSSGAPGAYLFGWLGSWTGALLPIGVALLILVFPTGRPVGWWRIVAVGPLAGAVATVVGAALVWGLPLTTLVDQDALSATDVYGLIDAGFILGFASAIPATISVVARFRRAGLVERQQIKWLLAATCLFAVAYIVGSASSDNDIVWWVVAAAMAAIPLAILLAVLRYRLYDVDRVLSRTVSYVVVVGLLGGVYLVGLTALTSFLPAESPLAVAGSTLAVAALFNPVRKKVQTLVDRRFNRSRYNAEKVIERFSGSLRDTVDAEHIVGGWVDVVAATMKPASVGVWTREAG